jgi:hypothetical protein
MSDQADIWQRAAFYVSVVNGRRRGLLLGPYGTHDEALTNVERGQSLAEQADAFAHFFAFGTCKITSHTLPKSVFGE